MTADPGGSASLYRDNFSEIPHFWKGWLCDHWLGVLTNVRAPDLCPPPPVSPPLCRVPGRGRTLRSSVRKFSLPALSLSRAAPVTARGGRGRVERAWLLRHHTDLCYKCDINITLKSHEILIFFSLKNI